MKKPTRIAAMALFAMTMTTPLHAGQYAESLSAADAALNAGRPGPALDAIQAALAIATNPGERGLALAKKAYVLAFSMQNYPEARSAAETALALPDMEPVVQVTALQALAECQIKAHRDFTGAINNLETAMALPGVDWAQPGVGFALAEAYRESMLLQQAFDAYQRVTGMANASPDLKANAWLHMGFIYQYDRKDAAGARHAYARAVEFRPNLQTDVASHLAKLTE